MIFGTQEAAFVINSSPQLSDCTVNHSKNSTDQGMKTTENSDWLSCFIS